MDSEILHTVGFMTCGIFRELSADICKSIQHEKVRKNDIYSNGKQKSWCVYEGVS